MQSIRRFRPSVERWKTGPILGACLVGALTACGSEPLTPSAEDQQLRDALRLFGVTPLAPPPAATPDMLRLGQALMFDKELSGNRDISCGTCHAPRTTTTERLSLSVGTANTGQGDLRRPGAGRGFVPRHTPELFNRGAREFTTMFWDGSVHRSPNGALVTPVGPDLPPGIAGPLAAQALFPLTSPVEMKGKPGDLDVRGNPNELALVANDDFTGLWQAIMDRVLAIPAYVTLFRQAYPGLGSAPPGIAHAVNAIAAFEATTWHSAGSPFDRYLAGDDGALDAAAKRGALLFFGVTGDVRCVACHSGPLLTDMRFANIGIPAIGPGKNPEAPFDFGRERVTGNPGDRFAFRTPPLRNVELTGPWMHNGAYTTLEGAVRHYLDPPTALRQYDATQLIPELAATHDGSEAVTTQILATLDPRIAAPSTLTDADVADLLAFLRSLTDPAARHLEDDIPVSVPSGLPVD